MPKKTPKELFEAKVAQLLKAEQDLDAAVVAHQQKLFELLVSEYLPLFDLEDGVIIDSPNNDALIAKLDAYFDKLEKAMYRDVLGGYATNLLQSAEASGEYYIALGFKRTVVTNLLRDKVRLEAKLGITPTGRLQKDGYLYRLGKTEQVRQQLKDYVIRNLTGDTSFLDFQLGFRNLVIGNKRVQGLATTGVLQRYFDQYAYDSFNQLDATANKQLAANLELKHFVYEGSVIKTTRPFCRKRAGKAYTVKETKKWKDDPDLVDKKTKDSYRVLVERGRYRCRHFIRYITEELYNELK